MVKAVTETPQHPHPASQALKGPGNRQLGPFLVMDGKRRKDTFVSEVASHFHGHVSIKTNLVRNSHLFLRDLSSRIVSVM